MHTHLQEKRQNKPHFATETSASVMGFSLWSGRFLFTESFWNMLRASDINILQQVLCLFRYRKPLVRLSLTHWLITWFCLIYKISKSCCFLPYPWLQILPCNVKWSERVFHKIPEANQPKTSCARNIHQIILEAQLERKSAVMCPYRAQT